MTGKISTRMLGAMAAAGLATGLLCGASTSASATNSAVSTKSTTQTPIQVMAFAKPAASTIGPVTINCGLATCSAYLSRSVTKTAYGKEIVGGGGYAATAGVICAPLLVPPLTPLGIACGAAATVQGGWISQELSDAATQHGAKGACLKVTYTKIGPPVITWWSTNNGQYCKD